MLNLAFDPVQGTHSEAQKVYDFAKHIWYNHYIKYYSERDVLVGLEMYLAPNVIVKEIESGFRYFFMKANDQKAGILSFKPMVDEKMLYLGKFYLSDDFRRKGIGQKAMDFTEKFARERELEKIQCQCAELNVEARKAYTRMGFSVAKKFVEDLEGESSCELILEKKLSK